MRTRASIVIQSKTTTILIDTGPDVRDQLNREDIRDITGVIYTHTHADHVNGIDDLRGYVKRVKTPLDVYGTRATIDDLYRRFDYQFVQKSPLYPAVLNVHQWVDDALHAPITIGDITFTPFIQKHGKLKSLGFRFGDTAYCTDVSEFPKAALDVLRGVNTWIVDAAGHNMEYNTAHLTLKRVYKYQESVGAKRVIMTHLSLGMDYKTLHDETPAIYEPAYDGMVVRVCS